MLKIKTTILQLQHRKKQETNPKQSAGRLGWAGKAPRLHSFTASQLQGMTASGLQGFKSRLAGLEQVHRYRSRTRSKQRRSGQSFEFPLVPPSPPNPYFCYHPINTSQGRCGAAQQNVTIAYLTRPCARFLYLCPRPCARCFPLACFFACPCLCSN